MGRRSICKIKAWRREDISACNHKRRRVTERRNWLLWNLESWRSVRAGVKYCLNWNTGPWKSTEPSVCDGTLGFRNAVDEICGQLKIQRCWFHKTANILDKIPKCVQKKATNMIRDMHMATPKENALKADNFVETFEAKYEKAVENLKKDKEDLFRFYDYPAGYWTHIKTRNPIESTFATVLLRHNSTKGNGTANTTEAMLLNSGRQAEKGWQRLRDFEKLELVARNIKFKNGVLKETA